MNDPVTVEHFVLSCHSWTGRGMRGFDLASSSPPFSTDHSLSAIADGGEGRGEGALSSQPNAFRPRSDVRRSPYIL